MKQCQKIDLQEPQRNRNATANFVNLIMTSTVPLKPVLGGVDSVALFITVNEQSE